MPTPELVIVGRVRRAHGVHGELVVETLTDSPDEVFAAGRQLVAGTVDGEPDARATVLTIESVRPGTAAGGILVKFDAVALVFFLGACLKVSRYQHLLEAFTGRRVMQCIDEFTHVREKLLVRPETVRLG